MKYPIEIAVTYTYSTVVEADSDEEARSIGSGMAGDGIVAREGELVDVQVFI